MSDKSGPPNKQVNAGNIETSSTKTFIYVIYD